MEFNFPGYPVKFIQRQRCKDGSAHLFTLIYKFFSPVTRYHYIIRAEYHKEDVFAIKFYCKKDRRSDTKYSKIINKGDLGNIFNTCINLLPEILSLYPTVSFAILGARSYDPMSDKVEQSTNTQRFRIYKYIATRKFGHITFAHFEYTDISGYMLVNRSSGNVENREREIAKMFARTYNEIPL